MAHELERVADFITNFRIDSCGKDVIDAATLCVLDTVGVAVGAGNNKQNLDVIAAFKNLETGCEDAGVWGSEVRLSALRAGYVNAMLGHTLELDDVHVRSKTHIGTVVIPAAWAMAEKLGKSGRDFLEAVIAAYEVMARIGMGFGVSSHREKGWHVTSTAGTFGAAAATAKMMGLTAEQTANALGLAGTQSFGLWAFLEAGSTNKVLHPAHAAMSGMESAVLAGAGMTGPVGILTAADGGLFAAMSDAYDISLVTDGLGERFEILQLDKKPYPCCRSAHCAIDAALMLRKEHGLTPENVRGILVKTYKVGYMQVGCNATSLDPKLPSDAKFSTPYCVACAVLDGGVGLAQFEPAMIARPEARAMLAKVRVAEDAEFTGRYPRNWGCRMEVTMTDGSAHSVEVPDASGSVGAPMSAAGVREKAVLAAGMVLGGGAGALAEKLLDIAKAPSLRGYLSV